MAFTKGTGLTLIAFVLLGVGALRASAQTPIDRPPYMPEERLAALRAIPMNEALNSQALLMGAATEMGSFSRQQIEAIARFLGDCANRYSSQDVLRAYCDRAGRYLEAVTPTDGPFGKLLFAIQVSARLASAAPSHDARALGLMRRISEIERSWDVAIQYRLRQLEDKATSK